MNAIDLMAKASRAAASAQLLLDAGDVDGACNRAYYAMFDAARASLIAASAPVELEQLRTHGGLIGAFSLHLVKTGQVDVEWGRALNRAEEIRLVADYKGEAVRPDHAEWIVSQARDFVERMRRDFLRETPP